MKATTVSKFLKQCFSGPLGDVRGGNTGRNLASHQPRRHTVAAHVDPRLTGPAEAPLDDRVIAAPSGSTQRPADIPRVLHIDSDPASAAVLSTLLVPEACVVHVATLAEARQMLQHELFSLVVLDPGLSDGDGAALLPALAATPLLVYSARMPEWRGQPGMYLPKPWTSPRQLWSTISTMLGIAPGLTAGD